MFRSFDRFWRRGRDAGNGVVHEHEVDAATIHREAVDLKERLQISERALRERTERLYNLEQHYSSEHFALQESLRDLKTERMRNAGAYGRMATILARSKALQIRIAALKERLRRYEPVDDVPFDLEPIVAEGDV